MQKITRNLIETVKTSIYDPKHTQHTKIQFHLFNTFENTSFQQLDFQTNQRFMLYSMVLLIFVRAAQPN